MNPGGPPRVLGIVADDLTGAGDSAVAFAEHGWHVLLHLNPRRIAEIAPPTTMVPRVVAVSTGARALPDQAAATVTADAINALRAAGADRIYLKIDSTVRGSIAGQITGALRAWTSHFGDAQAAICPAFPDHHRVVVGGHVLVNGVPLGGTAAATDPVTPRTNGDLTDIVPGAVRGEIGQVGAVRQLILDAASNADLDGIAAGLAARGPEIVIVGSGGLAAALARRWSHPGAISPADGVGPEKVLIAASSLHPTTTAQLNHLRRSTAAGPFDILRTHDHKTTPARAADDLARRVAHAVAANSYRALIAIGGDGAAAILDRLVADHVIVDGAIDGGCPTGIISGGHADGIRLVTKSGGFGGPTALTTIITRLRNGGPIHQRSAPDPASARLTKKDV